MKFPLQELFLLVTDQGFLKEPRVVWETLSDIDGDCHFVDEKFVTAPPKEESAVEAALPVEPLTPEQQIDREYVGQYSSPHLMFNQMQKGFFWGF